MIGRLLLFSHVPLALSVSLFVTGCASLSGTTPRAVVSQSYDLPGTLDANAVIRAVERSFARTFSRPPRIVEGSVPSPLPAMPAPFRVEERLVHVDRLGMVRIPEVICPESMAVVQALVADRSESSGPHSLTGCIQLYAGGYRVSLVASDMVVDRRDAIVGLMDSEPPSEAGLLSRVAHALREEIPAVRPVSDSRAPASTTPVGLADAKNSTDGESSPGERSASLAAPPERSETTHATYREEGAVSTLPLVCLAPKHESAPVTAARGEGGIITTLKRGSVIVAPEPVDAAYFRVETENGTVGWVSGAEVKRLTCPIG